MKQLHRRLFYQTIPSRSFWLQRVAIAVYDDYVANAGKKMDTIERNIVAELEEIPSRAKEEEWSGESPWTRAVKQALVDVGRKFHWLTVANGCDSDDGSEWLYDVVWYQADKSDHFVDIFLVAESEWEGENAIKVDFEKLLVARTKYRVMIFQAGSDENIERIAAQMKLWVAKFRRA